MEIVFDRLRSSSDHELAGAAGRAAETYRERRMRLQSRMRIYTGSSISVRLNDFYTLMDRALTTPRRR